jgi:protein-disulfide isomerase
VIKMADGPGELAVEIDGLDHAQGSPEAAVSLVWYGDYECPTCKRVLPMVKRVQEVMGKDLRLVFRHFPKNSVFTAAPVAARAAEAAAGQGKFWAMHDLLFEHQAELAEMDLTHLALQAGLEVYRFEADLSSQRHARKVRRDYDSGVASGVRGTPTFFINGRRYSGALEYDAMLGSLMAARDRTATDRAGV